MTTVINNPGVTEDDSGLGVILGVLIAIIAIALFFVYGLPAIRDNQEPQGTTDTTNINVQVPATKAPTSP